MVAEIISLFTGVKGFEEAQQALEELNKGKRGHYNKDYNKPKPTNNKWEYMRSLYAHLADFFEVPRFQLREDEEFLFAGGKIRAWCFVYKEEDEEDDLRELQNY